MRVTMKARRVVAYAMIAVMVTVMFYAMWWYKVGQYAEIERIRAQDTIMGDHAADLRTGRIWRLENHVGDLVWVRRTDIGMEVKVCER